VTNLQNVGYARYNNFYSIIKLEKGTGRGALPSEMYLLMVLMVGGPLDGPLDGGQFYERLDLA